MPVTFAAGQPFHDHVLTDFYLPIFADARNNSAVLWSLLPKGRRRVAGKFIKFPVRTTRNDGGNAIMPGGDLPTAGSQGSDFHTFLYRHYYQSIQIDGVTMDAASMDAATYADVIDTEVNGAFDDVIIEQNRMAHNDGSGRLCEVSAVAADTTTGAGVTLVVNSSIAGNVTCPTAPTKFLEVGMRIAFHAPGDDTPRGTVGITTVASIVDDDTILTAIDVNDGGTPVAAGDWVVRVSGTTIDATSSAFRAEPMGIAGIMVDTGVLDGNGIATGQVGATDRTGTTEATAGFQGVEATSTEPFNQGIVLDGNDVARPLTEALLQQAFSDAEELNNANIDFLLSSYATYNSYFNVLKGDKRYNDTLELAGGHKLLTFNGVGFIKDRFCYGGRVCIMATDQYYLYEVVPLEWVDYDGLKFRKISGKDDWEANLKTRYTLGVDVRQRAGANLVDLAA